MNIKRCVLGTMDSLRQKVSAALKISVRGIKNSYFWLRFGKISKKTTAEINGIACEIEIYGRGDKIIGFWAYGSYDPNLPFQG